MKTKFKVDKTIKELTGNTVIEHRYSVNDVSVAVFIKKWAQFPPMNINRWSWAYYLSWDRYGLEQILGSKSALDKFKDIEPDFVFEYAGEKNIDEKYIAEKIIPHLNADVWKIK